MSEYSAKTLRDKAKAKARALANPGNYARDQEVSSANWSPAPPLRTEIKTGARPIMKPSAKGTGESYAARDTKAAIGKDMKRGAFKSGGAVKRKDGGSVPSAAETEDTKARLGSMKIKPVRGAAQHYKKGGKIKRADGGRRLTDPEIRAFRMDRNKYDAKPEDYTQLPTETIRRGSSSDSPIKRYDPANPPKGLKRGGSANWIAGAIKNKGALHRDLGVPQGEKIPAKKLAKAADKPGKVGKRARLAETLKGFKRADGGSLPSPEEAIGSEVRMKGLKVMPARDNSAAAQVTPSQLRREEGYTRADMMAKRPGRAMGGCASASPLSSASKAVSGRAMGGRKGKNAGKTRIDITINAGQKPQPIDLSAGQPGVGPGAPPPPMPPVGAPGIGAPPPAMMPPPPMGAAPMARKSGGRLTKVAKSYKDMQAGSGSGESRLQKTDIAKLHKNAPSRKTGGAVRGK